LPRLVTTETFGVKDKAEPNAEDPNHPKPAMPTPLNMLLRLMMVDPVSSVLCVWSFVGIIVLVGAASRLQVSVLCAEICWKWNHVWQITPRGKQTRHLEQGKKTQKFPHPPESGHFVAIPH
jgi:hypothetical protein